MATIATRRRNPFMPILFFAAIFIIVLGVISQGVSLGTHANKHSLANAIRNCPDDKLGLILVDPISGNRAKLCEFAPGQWGRYITRVENGIEKEQTAFANSERASSNTFETAFRNLVRQGYNQAEFIRPDLKATVLQILAGGW